MTPSPDVSAPDTGARRVTLYRTSPAQDRMWFAHRSDPVSPLYNVFLAARIEGRVDDAALETALSDVVARHEVLRTSFRTIDDELHQLVAAHGNAPLDRKHAADTTSDFFDQTIAEAATAPFDLTDGPLMRTVLFSASASDHVMLVTFHHIVVDGWSLELLCRDITEAYAQRCAGRAPRWAVPEIGYGDVCEWWAESDRQQHRSRQVDRWREVLTNPPVAGSDLPLDRVRTTAVHAEAGRREFSLDAEASELVRSVARRCRTTPVSVALAAFAALLGIWSDTDDLVLGLPVAGRTHPDTQDMVGLFVNTLPLRLDVQETGTFTDLVHNVTERTTDALDMQDAPLDDIVAAVGPDRAPGRTPLFDVLFTGQNTSNVALDLTGTRSTTYDVRTSWTRYDLEMNIWDEPRLRGMLVHRASRFDEETATALIAAFCELLRRVCAAPERPVGESTGAIPLPVGAADRPDAERDTVEATLRALPGVADLVVLRQTATDGTDRAVAYVSAEAPVTEERITAAARNAGHRIDGVVLVGSIPHRADGSVDVAAFSAAPVIDAVAAERWQRELRRDDTHVVVAVADRPGPEPSTVDIPPVPSESAVVTDHRPVRVAGTGSPAQCDGGPTPAASHASVAEALRVAAHTDHGIVLVSEAGRRERVSYRELEVSARRVATSLRARVQSVDTPVLVAFRDNRELLPVLWGCVLAGVIAVPWVPPAGPDELQERLASVRTTLGAPLIVAEGCLHESLVAAGAEIIGFAELAEPAAGVANNTFEPAATVPNPHPDDTVLLLLTSGSTGTSKAVRVTHRMILTRSAGAATMCGVGPDDVSLNWMPLDHVGGVVMYHMRDVVLGAEQLQVATTWILADPLRWIDLLGEYDVTNTWAPNFAFGLVAEAAPRLAGRKVSLEQVHHILNGGEAVRRATVSAFLEALVPLGLRPDAVRPSWGMSETCSGETDSDRCTVEHLHAGSGPVEVGRPYPGFSVRIVDETCAVVDEGVVGRLQVCGDAVTPGYWNDPERTAEAMTDDGWFDTGDLAVLDDGRLTLTGRVKDVVIVNGRNFACEDIEQAVERRCAVRDSSTAAIAVPDAATGSEHVVVITVPAAGNAAADRAALASRVRAATRSVTGHAPIVGFAEWDSLPRTGIGKIQRNLLQSAYRERTLQAEFFVPRGADSTTVPDLFAVPRWVRSTRRASTSRVRRILLATPTRGSVSEIADRLECHGVDVRILTDINGLADAMIHRPDLVVFVDETGETRDSVTEAAEISVAVVGAYRSMVRILDEPDTDRTLVVLTSGLHAPGGGGPDHLSGQVLNGLLRSVAAESLGLRTRSIDSGPGTAADDLAAELLYGGLDDEVALDADARWVRRLNPFPREKPSVMWPDRGDAIVLTGGTGALGITLAEHLLGARGCSVLLIGSTDSSLMPERASQLARLVAEFGEERVRIASADVTDPSGIRNALHAFEAHVGRPVSGAVHLAGRFVEGPFAALDDDGLSAVARAKIVGAGVLHDVLTQRPGSHLLLCSSVSGYLGAPHAAAYAAANSFLDGLAAWASEHSTVACRSVAWSMWESTGASRDFTQSDRTAARGTVVLPPDLAARMWPVVLATPELHLLAGVDRSVPFVRSRCAIDPGPVRTLSVSGVSGTSPVTGPVDVFGNTVPFVCTDTSPRESNAVDVTVFFRGPLEELVAEQWCAVLGFDEVDRNTSFFDLGGASLHLSRVHDRLQRRLGREIALTDLFRHHTIATLAAHLARNERDTAPARPDTPAARRGRERAATRRRRRTP